jgi:hypothetical protein
MTSGEAKRIVLGSVAAAGAISAVRDLSGGTVPRIRIFVGAATAGALLAMLADLAPNVAAMFALTLATTAVFTAGAKTWQSVGRIFT